MDSDFSKVPEELSKAKQQTKNSVFVHLFGDENNVLKLYKELHPDDTTVTIKDINVQTLESVLINNIYNDLGFIVNEGENAKYVMLIEAQSSWNPNMTLRLLFYLTETYRHYLVNTRQNVHQKSRVKLPKPELYVVYTGDRKNPPSEISFKADFFDGDSPIDLKAKVLHNADSTIYGQYIGFCKVFDEQRKIYGYSVKCIEETIRICIDKNYLADFLKAHRQEVVTMLSELFDEQAQREEYNIAHDREVREEGKAEGIFETLVGLVKKGILSLAQAASEANMTVSEFEIKSGLKNV